MISGTRIVYVFFAMVFVYVAATIWIPARFLIEMGDAFAIPMSLAAFGVYCREVWGRPNDESITATDIVMIGIAGGWLTNALDRTFRLWARIHDASVLNEPIIGLFLFMLMFFAAMHVQVRGSSARTGNVSMQGTRIVAAALLVGVLLSVLVLYLELT